MKIVQISDCHLFTDKTKVGYQDINPHSSLQKILVEVKAQDPDRVIVTGDVSGDGTQQSYQHFSRLLEQAEINAPLAILPGNHDNEYQLRQQFAPEHLWLSGPFPALEEHWHIHLLNTKTQDSRGKISESCLAQLDEHLNEHKQQYHLIAVHHHPIACEGWMDSHEWLNRRDFVELVKKHHAVKGVVYGHIHMDVTQNKGGCLYMACPSTCWQWACEKSFAACDLAPGFRVINLAKNGQIETKVVRLS